jgi:hypothetical protein
LGCFFFEQAQPQRYLSGRNETYDGTLISCLSGSSCLPESLTNFEARCSKRYVQAIREQQNAWAWVTTDSWPGICAVFRAGAHLRVPLTQIKDSP